MDFLTCSCIELSVCTWLCDAMVHVLNSSNKNVQKKKIVYALATGGRVASIVMGRDGSGKGPKCPSELGFVHGVLKRGVKGSIKGTCAPYFLLWLELDSLVDQ